VNSHLQYCLLELFRVFTNWVKRCKISNLGKVAPDKPAASGKPRQFHDVAMKEENPPTVTQRHLSGATIWHLQTITTPHYGVHDEKLSSQHFARTLTRQKRKVHVSLESSGARTGHPTTPRCSIQRCNDFVENRVVRSFENTTRPHSLQPVQSTYRCCSTLRTRFSQSSISSIVRILVPKSHCKKVD
jgi:hypothetical protein